MSEKYENPSATYNIPLNISENDIFHIGRAHLQHFLLINVKMADCKPMMLKMHLELDDSPSVGEAEQRNIVHNSSINGLRQSVQQLEEEMKALKDALLQAMDDVVNRIDKAPDVDNNATQESKSKKQANNENKLNGEHNDTENVASASEGHHTNTIPEEKLEVIDLRRNCVYIESCECVGYNLEKAFCHIRKLANEMNVEIPDDSVIHIDVEFGFDSYDYYVHFSDASIKETFLKNRHFYVYQLFKSPLRIFDYSEWGIVDIKNFQSSDLSLEAAYVNVIGIAKKMGITNERYLRDSIDHIDVFKHFAIANVLTYSLRFTREFMRKEFLQRKDILKRFPETESLEITEAGGHRLSFRNINNTVASANVIGVAELIGLSLATDNLKRIYVLNNVSYYCDRGFTLIVEFSSKHVKDEFLKKNIKSKEKGYLKHYPLTISNVNAKKNVVLIKYVYGHVTTAISFIGLAKQLGFSLSPDKIQHFFDLSKFIDDAKRNEEK